MIKIEEISTEATDIPEAEVAEVLLRRAKMFIQDIHPNAGLL